MEKTKTEEKAKWMNWKRILLFSLLFSILAGSLIYYVLPRVLLVPLRIDSVPQDAYIVPWMRPSLSFDEITSMTYYDIDAVMTGVLKLDMTFTIDIVNDTRIVPSTVYLGHDKTYLYIGGKFRSMYENPTTTAQRTLANFFNTYFDVANDDILDSPESGSMLDVYVNPEACLSLATSSLVSL